MCVSDWTTTIWRSHNNNNNNNNKKGSIPKKCTVHPSSFTPCIFFYLFSFLLVKFAHFIVHRPHFLALFRVVVETNGLAFGGPIGVEEPFGLIQIILLRQLFQKDNVRLVGRIGWRTAHAASSLCHRFRAFMERSFGLLGRWRFGHRCLWSRGCLQDRF